MWRDPDDEKVEDTITKVERVAATRRSTIRREPSVRPGRDEASSQGSQGYLNARNRVQNMWRIRDRLLQEDRDTESQIAQLQEELEQLRRTRLRYRTRTNREHVSARAGRDIRNPGPADSSTPNNENENATGEEVVEPADTIRQHLPRPSRESNLRFEVLPASTSRSSSPWRYQVLSRTSIPSPPHSAGSEHRDRSIPDGPLPFDDSIMPALTEGFAPAQPGSRDLSYNFDPPQQPEDEGQGLETPPPETWESSYPPLRRVSHMSPRPLPRVDGLGDRRRSPSPAAMNEEETWATLLTNMDAGRSSTRSFESSQSDSQQRSGRASQNTSASFGEIGLADDTCDLDLPPGITEEDVLEMRARHRPARNRNAMTGRRGLQEHQDRITEHVEVGMFRAILDRMHRREDIPDEWWATVGLSPDLGRPQ
jgi:hypothetical protein